MKPEVFTVKETKELRAKEEEHCMRMEKASVEETLVIEEVAQLKVLLLSSDRKREPMQIDQMALISSVIQRIFQ